MRFTAVQCFDKCVVVKEKTPTISSALMSSNNTLLVTCGLFANNNVRTVVYLENMKSYNGYNLPAFYIYSGIISI